MNLDQEKWFVADASGKQQGPLSGSQLRQLASAGKLSNTFLWREGLESWRAAAEFSELFPAVAPSKAATASVDTGRREATGVVQGGTPAPVDQVLAHVSSPLFFKRVGRFSIAAAVLLFVLSCAGFAFGYSWFAGVMSFAILGVLGQGISAILESLHEFHKK
jgi:hypothetical protein